MKTIYLRPECNASAFNGQTEILTGSYNRGGASQFGDDDIFDNGSY